MLAYSIFAMFLREAVVNLDPKSIAINLESKWKRIRDKSITVYCAVTENIETYQCCKLYVHTAFFVFGTLHLFQLLPVIWYLCRLSHFIHWSDGTTRIIKLTNWRPIWRSGGNTRLLRKRSRVRFPHCANICVH
jgi:hypothetical protein